MTLDASASPHVPVDPAVRQRQQIPLRSILLLLLSCAAILAWYRRGLEAQPFLTVFGGKTYQAGTVQAGVHLTHQFRIYNPHDYAVTIETYKEGCECSQITVRNPVLLPHRSTMIEVSTEATGKGDHTEAFRLLFKHARYLLEEWLFVHYISDLRAKY